MANGSQRKGNSASRTAAKPAAPTAVRTGAPRARESLGADALHLAVLTGFAVAQPLLDLLSRNAQFFVARRSQPIDIIAMVLFVCAGVPAVLAAVELVVGAVSRPARRVVHLAFVALLVTATALPPLKRLTDDSAILVPAALVFGGGAAAVLTRFAAARTFLSILVPAPLVFAALFFVSPVSALLRAGKGIAYNVTVGAPAPVVMLVFDEFSQISLLDERGLIDEVRYPNIGALARESTWYRNATTVSYHTEMAVPALLSGIYPEQKRLQTAADYPNNIFTLLGSTYDMVVDETVTRLCPKELCDPEPPEPPAQRLSALLSDLTVVYLHIVLPGDLAAALPSVSDRWEGFGLGAHRRATPPAPTAEPNATAEPRMPVQRNKDAAPGLGWALRQDRLAVFNHFLSSLHATDRPTLFFLHLLLPHTDWRYLPSGKDYNTSAPMTNIDCLLEHGIWCNDEWLVTQAFQRYLLQVALADRLVGQLVARLKEVGIYDEALLIVVADHGVSSIPNEPRRGPGPTGYPELLLMPLFIKAPHQRDGAISDRNVQIIDLLSTIASILKVQLPFPVDGQSAVDSSLPEPGEKRLLLDNGTQRIFDSKLEARAWNLQRQIALFGTGTTRPDGLFRLGPHSEIIGRAVTDADREPAPGMLARVEFPDIFLDVKPDGPFVPAHITGKLAPRQLPETTELAIAVNGTIAGVTRPYRKMGERRFQTVVAESFFRPGDNDVQVFLMSEVDGHVQLREISQKAPDEPSP